ncbi:hypothetical protein DFJ74DRAFT_677259 [Hyaloraphidium curvatum]|nr:hypothetical protein DFJ74DRAFT_677259 [Hyaloraphidium curvatum]
MAIVVATVGVTLLTVAVVLGVLLWRKRLTKRDGRKAMMNESIGRLNRSRSMAESAARGAGAQIPPDMVQVDLNEESIADDAQTISTELSDYAPRTVLGELSSPHADGVDRGPILPANGKAPRKALPPPIQTRGPGIVQRTDSFAPSIAAGSGDISPSIAAGQRSSPAHSPTSPTSMGKSPVSAFARSKQHAAAKVVTFLDSAPTRGWVAPGVSTAALETSPPRPALLSRAFSAASAYRGSNETSRLADASAARSASMRVTWRQQSLLVKSSGASVVSEASVTEDSNSVLSGPSALSVRDVQLGHSGRPLVSLPSGIERGRLAVVSEEEGDHDLAVDEVPDSIDYGEVFGFARMASPIGESPLCVEPGDADSDKAPVGTAQSSPTLEADKGGVLHGSDGASWSSETLQKADRSSTSSI